MMLKLVIRSILASLFVFAAIAHFNQTDAFASIMPGLIPFKMEIVLITGVIEGLLGLALLPPSTKRKAGIGLALYSIAVLPANINMAYYQLPLGENIVSAPLLWFRVALQFPLIAVILWSSDNWPAKGKQKPS